MTEEEEHDHTVNWFVSETVQYMWNLSMSGVVCGPDLIDCLEALTEKIEDWINNEVEAFQEEVVMLQLEEEMGECNE